MRPLNRPPFLPSPRQPHDSVRWFVIGAYQAGCSTSRISDMTHLSENAVRNIVRNFQHTGSPSHRRIMVSGPRNTDLITAQDVIQHVLQQTQDNSNDDIEQQVWTEEDDRALLHFVLSRLNGIRWHDSRWQQLESTLDGRHTARECQERWETMRPILLETINLSGTQGW
ncbi:hypothetical protein BX666DRAFT_1915987 [Dichotomocladium elegans]|nr:hypothetical protein BX666DRAFT_1915987 [Dichotomocladium elegans]